MVDNKTNKRRFSTETRYASNSQNCSTNSGTQSKPDANDTSRDKRIYSTNRGSPTKSNADNASGDKTHIPNYFNSNRNKSQISVYFIPANKGKCETMTNRIHNKFNDLFSGIGCFEVIFSLQVKVGSHWHMEPPMRVAYALQKPLKEDLEWLHKHQLIVSLSVDDTMAQQFCFSTQS